MANTAEDITDTIVRKVVRSDTELEEVRPLIEELVLKELNLQSFIFNTNAEIERVVTAIIPKFVEIMKTHTRIANQFAKEMDEIE